MELLIIAVISFGFEPEGEPDAVWVPVDTLEARAASHMERAHVGQEFRADTKDKSDWEFLGPMPITGAYWSDGMVSGRTSFVLPHPTDTSIIYIAAAQGGVWKTTDRGNTWQPVSDNLTSLASGALAFDPSDPDVIYYGTGEMHHSADSKNGDGLFKTTDAGNTWVKIATTSQVGSYISRVLVNPADPNIILVANNHGIARSSDRGSSWSTVLSGSYVHDIVMHSNNSTYYAAVADQGVYMSTDTGKTWSMLSGGLPASTEPFYRIQLAMAPSNNSVIYAAFTDNDGGLYGLYKTTDAGSSWTLLSNTPNYLYPQGWYDNCIIVDPTDANTVYAGGVFPYTSGYYGIVKTTDGGNSWTDITDRGYNGIVHPDIHHFAFDPNGDLWVVCDGGVWMTTDGGSSWINKNQTLGTIQFYEMALDPADTSCMQGGAQDNGTSRREGSLAWFEILSGDGGSTRFEIDATASRDTSFATYQRFSGPYRFVNGIYNADCSGPWVGVDRTSWCSAPLVTVPNSPSELLAGSQRVWRTTNSGNSWTAISTDLTGGSGYLLSIAPAPSNTNIIYVGSTRGWVSVSTDNGGSWLNRTPTGSGYPVYDIMVNPNDPGEAYALNAFHVYHTVDTGKNWTDIGSYFSSNSILLRAMEVDFDCNPAAVMVGGEGIFYSLDNGASWDTLGNGLPNTEIYEMELHPTSDMLVVATHGRSMWRLLGGWTSVLESNDPSVIMGLRWTGRNTVAFNLPAGHQLIKLYDLSGRLVKTLSVNGGKGQISLSGLEKGVYLLKTGRWTTTAIVR